MVSGVAVIWAVGCGAVAGGAVATGGGGCFFLQPPRATKQTSKTAGMKMRAFRLNAVLLLKSAAQFTTNPTMLRNRRCSLPFKSAPSVRFARWFQSLWNAPTLWPALDSRRYPASTRQVILSPCTPRSEKFGDTKNDKAKISSHFYRISAQVHRWYLPQATHFQLQFGIKLLPLRVSACCSDPSESMVQICVCPPIWRSNTMCRISGDHDG